MEYKAYFRLEGIVGHIPFTKNNNMGKYIELNEDGRVKDQSEEQSKATYLNNKKKLLLGFIPKNIQSLLYFDRKECEDVSWIDVADIIVSGTLTKKDLKDRFCKEIDKIF